MSVCQGNLPLSDASIVFFQNCSMLYESFVTSHLHRQMKIGHSRFGSIASTYEFLPEQGGPSPLPCPLAEEGQRERGFILKELW